MPLGNAEGVYDQVYSNIRSLRANGGTELYMAVRDVVTEMNKNADDGRIRAVVILSDGADTGDQNVTLQDAVRAIESSRESLNPILVIPVAYGSDADINALNAIARASNTRVQSGDPDSILRVLQIISSYF